MEDPIFGLVRARYDFRRIVVKHFNKEGEVVVKDIAELIAEAGEL